MLDRLLSTPTTRGWGIAQALLVHPGLREGAPLKARKKLYKHGLFLTVFSLALFELGAWAYTKSITDGIDRAHADLEATNASLGLGPKLP